MLEIQLKHILGVDPYNTAATKQLLNASKVKRTLMRTRPGWKPAKNGCAIEAIRN